MATPETKESRLRGLHWRTQIEHLLTSGSCLLGGFWIPRDSFRRRFGWALSLRGVLPDRSRRRSLARAFLAARSRRRSLARAFLAVHSRHRSLARAFLAVYSRHRSLARVFLTARVSLVAELVV